MQLGRKLNRELAEDPVVAWEMCAAMLISATRTSPSGGWSRKGRALNIGMRFCWSDLIGKFGGTTPTSLTLQTHSRQLRNCRRASPSRGTIQVHPGGVVAAVPVEENTMVALIGILC